MDTAIQAIDRLRVTASAHGRVFIVEVMGQDSGHLALCAGIAGGAQAIVLPEVDITPESIAAQILASYERGKSHAIVVVAEGARYKADGLASHFHAHHDERLGFEVRVTRLGHIQRGGAPGACDRLIASQLGAAAIEHITAGEFGISLGITHGRVTATRIPETISAKKPLNQELLHLAQLLTR